ncbi:unnamed protein product [marine sediment metagenome]|jgi:hypothetical protein|uniref:Uncharacterized protein n=1 Tax=marine sediment metagenome TaxID=412755 RepID=X1R6X6_9ZZZZ
MDSEKFKLNTRRYLAWGVVYIACFTGAFIAVWGALNRMDAYVTMAVVGLLELAAGVIGFYFGKKTSEE